MTNDLIERLDTCFKSAKSRWGQDEEYIWIETAYELLGEAIAALHAGAGVKPLEWTYDGARYVGKAGDEQRVIVPGWRQDAPYEFGMECFPTLEAAKTAAQEHLEKRIRSALSQPAQSRPPPEITEDDLDDGLSAKDLCAIDQAWENHKAALPVAVVINDNQPGRKAIIEITIDPPTLGVGTKLYAEPKAIDPLQPAQSAPANDAERIAEVVSEESANGAACGWISCSGCHETNEGAETGFYPYSNTFKCYVGSGCSECGGLGVVWEYWSEADLKAMASGQPALSHYDRPYEVTLEQCAQQFDFVAKLLRAKKVKRVVNGKSSGPNLSTRTVAIEEAESAAEKIRAAIEGCRNV
jgi:hypothetical protein